MSDQTYKSAVVYFWSGTGNSYRVSTWIGNAFSENGIDVKVISIDKNSGFEDIKNEDDTFVVVVFPTHGFTAPWHILKFIWGMPKTTLTNTYCVSTRAGLKFGSIFTPGISGSATFITSLLLKLKGYKVAGAMSVDMPSNWFSFHPIQSKESHEAIIGRAKDKVISFMEKVVQKKKIWFTLNNLYEIVWGFLLSFISVAYLVFGRFFLAKLFFANNRCDGCGVCAGCCSVDAIELRGEGKPKPFWKFSCESCMRCAAFCPRNAIEAGHSWGVILYFITAIPVSAYILSWLDLTEAGLIGSIISLLYYYPAIFISYFIFNSLVQIPIINSFFTYTTMTHLPFWKRYIEPNTKLKDIISKKKKEKKDP